MAEELKPDLGLAYLNSGFSVGQKVFFYSVTFPHIEVIGKNSFTIMQNIESDGVHAVSFDFGKPQFDALLSQLTEKERVSFILSIHGRKLPFRVALPRPITSVSVECRLGNLVEVEKERFAPFVIDKINFDEFL